MEYLNLHGWLPIRIGQEAGEWRVDWCWFGEQRLDKPLFRDAVSDALRLPFNQAFRRQTSLADLSRWQAESPGRSPSAFIYHASRCGSTLLGQMLARLPSQVVLSEPPPIDTLLRIDLPPEQRKAALRGLLSAYGQVRGGQERALVVILEAWNIRERALLRECFPEVPWLYLYREPLDIAVSHMQHNGVQMVPGLIGSAWLDGDRTPAGREEEIARRLGLMLGTAVEHCRAEGNLLLAFSELPAAMNGPLADFFGLDQEEAKLACAVAGCEARLSEDQPGQVPAALRKQVEHFTRQPYLALEALRLAAR